MIFTRNMMHHSFANSKRSSTAIKGYRLTYVGKDNNGPSCCDTRTERHYSPQRRGSRSTCFTSMPFSHIFVQYGCMCMLTRANVPSPDRSVTLLWPRQPHTSRCTCNEPLTYQDLECILRNDTRSLRQKSLKARGT